MRGDPIVLGQDVVFEPNQARSLGTALVLLMGAVAMSLTGSVFLGSRTFETDLVMAAAAYAAH